MGDDGDDEEEAAGGDGTGGGPMTISLSGGGPMDEDALCMAALLFPARRRVDMVRARFSMR